MSEPLLPTTCSRGSNKLQNSSKRARRKQHTNLVLKIRCLIYFSIISLFYIQYLILNDSLNEQQTVEEASAIRYGRRSLSLASTSAIDLETSAGVPTTYTTSTTPPPPAPTAPPPPSHTHHTHTKQSPNCTSPAIFEFPSDGLTRAQREHGWICIHILLALYCFWLLAVVCDDYFLPAIEQICFTLNMQRDVVGATFMAAATSSPELFMNCVGTFVTKGDLGIGTIVGSSVFNMLAVPACCGLFVGQCVRLDWWPVTRDCLMYCVAVCALIGVLFDGKVMWYESLLLLVAYFFYMAVMYYNDKMARSARQLISKYRRKLHLVSSYREVSELTPLVRANRNGSYTSTNASGDNQCSRKPEFYLPSRVYPSLGDLEKGRTHSESSESSCESAATSDYADNPWQRSNRGMILHVLRWPITLLLWLTVPDSRKHPRCKYIAFLLSIAWIGVVSYLVAYAITIIGDTLNIPDSVMGLTILSAGMSVPEAVSSIIVTKQGQGAMGISNAIGSNTFDILLCLSVPWFIKAYFLPNNPAEMWVVLNSTGLTYSVVFLLTTLLGLYIAFLLSHFTLNWKIGLACSIMYVCFMIIASLIELNVFFPVNLPICKH